MKDKRNHHGAVGYWVNCFQNIFVNLPPLPLSCEISGALHLVLSGLMAGWQMKYRLISKFLKLAVAEIFEFLFHLTKVQNHYSLTNAFQQFFRVQPIERLIFKVQVFRKSYDF